jgi:hypothetical protein
MLMEQNDQVWIHVNRGWREAVVLAVLDGKALLEYEMPNGSTALRVVPQDTDDEMWYRNVSYRSLPKKWLRVLIETDWKGRPQQSADLAPSPIQVWQERGYSPDEIRVNPEPIFFD